MSITCRAIAIIPAAGVSARMGTPKLRLPWRGKTIIEDVVGAWRTSGVDRVLVVMRADDVELAAIVRQSGAIAVIADPPPPDMKASVQAGLQYAEANERPSAEDVWLMAPADLPAISSEVIRCLLRAHEADRQHVLVAGHLGRSGHPVLFPWRYASKVAELADDEGLNCLVERSGAVVIECGERALCADLDTPDDYKRWQEESRRDGQ